MVEKSPWWAPRIIQGRKEGENRKRREVRQVKNKVLSFPFFSICLNHRLKFSILKLTLSWGGEALTLWERRAFWDSNICLHMCFLEGLVTSCWYFLFWKFGLQLCDCISQVIWDPLPFSSLFLNNCEISQPQWVNQLDFSETQNWKNLTLKQFLKENADENI